MVYRIGYFPDVHYGNSWEEFPYVDESTFVNDLNHLYRTLNSEIVVWGGDQVQGPEPAVPHTRKSDIRSFWQAVEEVNGAIDNSYAITGNHDVPFDYWTRISSEFVDQERLMMPQKLQPVDGLTVLLISTQGPAAVQGGADSIAQDYGYVPLRQIEWMVKQIQAAHERGDIIIVFGHTNIWFATDPEIISYHPEAPFKTLEEAWLPADTSYEVIQNYQYVMDQLTDQAPVIYMSGHDWYEGPETYRNIDGVYHTWKNHYAGFGPSTYSYIDVNPVTGRVVFKTVESSNKSQNLVMDVTPDW